MFVNLDESWVSECNYHRRKWREPGDNNSLPQQLVSPRVSLIACLDSLGNILLSITQVTTTSEVMRVFLHHLAAKLDKTRPGWRKNHILLMDGASYHTSEMTMDVLKKLKIPTMFLGPNSYNTAVCELLFAALKTADLNPERLSLGKK